MIVFPYGPLDGVEVRVNANVTPGSYIIFSPNTVVVRHLSEFFVWLRSATWHVDRTTCPTWDDATECRCMTEGA